MNRFSHRRRALMVSAASALTGAAGATLGLPTGAWAQAAGASASSGFPDHTIRLVIPFAAGGGTDTLARLMARSMSQVLGQPVVPDNVAGADGTIGAIQVARAKPDGYTVMIGTPGTILSNPLMQPGLQYDPVRDFIPVAQFSDSPIILVVNRDTPWHSVQDLIKDARARPGAINFGSAGIGSIAHLSAEMFELLTGVKLTHVPFRGSAPAITAVRGGTLQVDFENLPPVLGMVKAGQLRALAIGSAKRSALLPDLPTIAESGVKGYESSSWAGLFAPAKTPPAIVARLGSALQQATRNPDVIKTMHDLGAEPVGSTSAQFRQFLAARLPLIAQTVKAAKLDQHS